MREPRRTCRSLAHTVASALRARPLDEASLENIDDGFLRAVVMYPCGLPFTERSAQRPNGCQFVQIAVRSDPVSVRLPAELLRTNDTDGRLA